MIRTFGDKETEKIFNRKFSRKLPNEIQRIALRKLNMIHGATELKDLEVPPGNKLEKLKGGLSEYHSIRINDQWRIIFIWSSGNAEEVEIKDYHK
jgi:proteic killer suppression protein